MSVGQLRTSETLRDVLLFVIKLAVIYLLWRVFSIFVGAQSTPVDERVWPWLSTRWLAFNDFFTLVLAKNSRTVLELMGYETQLIGINLLKIKGYGGVGIGHYCLGMELMVLFMALVISFPTWVGNKLWFSFIGITGIHFINVLRIVTLSLMLIYYPDEADFNHHYTFRIITFVFILLMYYWLIKKFGSANNEAPKASRTT